MKAKFGLQMQEQSSQTAKRFSCDNIVLQPTSVCNMDCTYCYLPERDKNRKMLPEVTRKLAESLNKAPNEMVVTWHGGEPLACGYSHFSKLIEPLVPLQQAGRITNVIQTNGTLIDSEWCEFFKRHKFHVSVSIDGTSELNANRVDWSGQNMHAKTLRGIEYLKKSGLPFTALAVVTHESFKHAKIFYSFFKELGCQSLGINIEEKLSDKLFVSLDEAAVASFWRELFQEWRADPVIKVREIDHVLSWMLAVCHETTGKMAGKPIDLIPTIAYDGDVCVLSPEFLNVESRIYDDFVVGNILQTPLEVILDSATYASYVINFLEGRDRCEQECEYYSFCGGGTAGNKYFEHGTTCATETAFCRNSEKALVDAIINSV